MKRINYLGTGLALALGLFASVAASADPLTCPGGTPSPNGANIAERVFNDCPVTTLSTTNAYPGVIIFNETGYVCFGGTNLHTWSFSTDGGASKAQFENCSAYRFCADVSLSGTTPNSEAGLRVSPWWSPDADGKFMINAASGEIACFGGRLPFYTFTGAYGITYTRGTTVHMEIEYQPNGLSSFHPATIVYKIVVGGTPYSSPALPFDEGNPSEAAVHGAWGELWPAYAGGYFQQSGTANGDNVGMTAYFSNICYEPLIPTSTTNSSWGRIKQIYR
jgi:hypothetical protein